MSTPAGKTPSRLSRTGVRAPALQSGRPVQQARSGFLDRRRRQSLITPFMDIIYSISGKSSLQQNADDGPPLYLRYMRAVSRNSTAAAIAPSSAMTAA